MIDPDSILTLAASGLVGLGMITAAALAGWQGWLRLKANELAARRDPQADALPHAGARIELADLKERIRKLEAIAAGVDL